MMKKHTILAGLVIGMAFIPSAMADNRLLQDSVEFTGAILFAQTGVPGLVIGAIRDGETAIAGFGTISDATDQAPNGETLMRIGSITKVFTGAVLANLAANGAVGLTDPLKHHLDWDVDFPVKNGHAIRLIDLVTHTSGLPREIDVEGGGLDNPFVNHTKTAYQANLDSAELLFPPGTGALYSNFAYNLLSWAMQDASGMAFPDLLSQKVLAPAGLTSTTYKPSEGQRANMMQGHGFDGEPWPDIPTQEGIYGSGGLYSSANDMLKWLSWHLDRFATSNAEMRLLDHASYVPRDTLDPVLDMDESGHMDAIGLGWVVMHPQGDQPLILQKAGGMQGIFSYVAFAPMRNTGVFVAINSYDIAAAAEMTQVANSMLSQLAPR